MIDLFKYPCLLLFFGNDNYPDVGEYYVCVKAMDENGVVKKTEYGDLTVVKPLTAGCTFSPGNDVKKGTNVTVTVNTDGGYGEMKYTFYYGKGKLKDVDKVKFEVLQATSQLDSANYTSDKPGDFVIYAVVEDEIGNTCQTGYTELKFKP